MSGALLTVVHVLVNVGFFVSLAFPVVTRFFWPWNRSTWGWNTVLIELSIAGCLFPSVLRLDFGLADLALAWTQVAFLGTVPMNVIWRAFIIWRTQRDGARGDERLGRPFLLGVGGKLLQVGPQVPGDGRAHDLDDDRGRVTRGPAALLRVLRRGLRQDGVPGGRPRRPAP